MRPCLKIKSINSAAAAAYVVINRCEFALGWCPGRLFVVQLIKRGQKCLVWLGAHSLRHGGNGHVNGRDGQTFHNLTLNLCVIVIKPVLVMLESLYHCHQTSPGDAFSGHL